VGDFALVGSVEIPRRLPDLVAAYLSEGGVSWPDVPGLAELMAASAAPPPSPLSPADGVQEAITPAPLAAADPQPTPMPAPTPQPTPQAQAAPTPPSLPSGPPAPAAATPGWVTVDAGREPSGFLDRVRTDPRGNGLAILVLAGMVAAAVRSLVLLRRPVPSGGTAPLDWLTPLLGLAGLGVAAYLAHVEVREVEAVCGPVGDCNTVQQSEYARLFGVVPIGVLGVLGFAAILVAWGVRRCGGGRAASWAAVAVLGMTGLGTLFSIYLTFLEPFVIGATCLWCLSSAVIMTALHALAHTPGRSAVAELGLRSSSDPRRRTT
jgi:uncharacterized membrane protein